MTMRVKICGVTRPDQGCEIARLGATALGFICVSESPRYVGLDQIREICDRLPPVSIQGCAIDRVGVFANAPLTRVIQTVRMTPLTAVQLHGDESPEFCAEVRSQLPEVEVIKAFRIRSALDLEQLQRYVSVVDTFLLDAYHPQNLGGTGKTLNWDALRGFHSPLPWLMAGGLNPDNVQIALSALSPDGIDLSSGVELSPGDKDLQAVKRLFCSLQACGFGRSEQPD